MPTGYYYIDPLCTHVLAMYLYEKKQKHLRMCVHPLTCFSGLVHKFCAYTYMYRYINYAGLGWKCQKVGSSCMLLFPALLHRYTLPCLYMFWHFHPYILGLHFYVDVLKIVYCCIWERILSHFIC